MSEKFDFTKSIVYKAGTLIKEMMGETLEIEEKTSASDLVTNVDKAIETFLVREINQAYTNQSFLTEEKTIETVETDDLWIIDPIDGTSNFIFQKENFSISVAYFEKEKPVFGFVYDVMNDKMYSAEMGVGAWLNDTPLETLNTETRLSESMITGDVYRPGLFSLTPSELKPRFIAHRFLGSGALETALVGSGHFGAYVFPKIKIWDVAAAMIILRQLGGTWTFGTENDQFIFDDEPRLFMGCQNTNIREALKALL